MYKEILLDQEIAPNLIGKILNKIKMKYDITKTLPKIFDNLYFEYIELNKLRIKFSFETKFSCK